MTTRPANPEIINFGLWKEVINVWLLSKLDLSMKIWTNSHRDGLNRLVRGVEVFEFPSDNEPLSHLGHFV